MSEILEAIRAGDGRRKTLRALIRSMEKAGMDKRELNRAKSCLQEIFPETLHGSLTPNPEGAPPSSTKGRDPFEVLWRILEPEIIW